MSALIDEDLELMRSAETSEPRAMLGLTIASALAKKNDATLSLRNHPQGGLEAIVRWANAASLGA